MKPRVMNSTMILSIVVLVSQIAFAANCEFNFTANGKTYYAIHNTTEGCYECLNPEHDTSPLFNDPSAEYLEYDNAFYAARVQHTCATEQDVSDYFTPMYISDEDVIAVSRGGTIVVSMDYGMLKEAYYGVPFFTADPEVYTGEEAVQFAQGKLLEAEFEKFCDEYARTGEAEAITYVLSHAGNDGGSFRESDLFMDTRLIGTKWITITRPVEPVDEIWSVRPNVNRISLRAKDGKLEVETTGWGGGLDSELILKSMKNAKPDIKLQQGSLNVQVFSLRLQLGAPVYVAVIRDKNGADKLTWDVCFRIGDMQRNDLLGYADGKDAVFCCILNDYEVQLMKDGASFGLLQ